MEDEEETGGREEEIRQEVMGDDVRGALKILKAQKSAK